MRVNAVGGGSTERTGDPNIIAAMTLSVSLTIAGVAVALTLLFGWLGARPVKPLSAPRLVPWRFMMMIAFVAVIAMLVHAVALVRAGG